VDRFLVHRGPGPAWVPGRALAEQPGWSDHARFMEGLVDGGQIRFGGPAGGRGAVALVAEGSNAESVGRRLAEDPWEQRGIYETSAIQGWTTWLGSDDALRGRARCVVALVHYAPGQAWLPGTARRDQPGWADHAAFMDALVASGAVLFGGPIDEQRAVVVFGPEEHEVSRMVADDPWVDGQAGVLIVSAIEPWTLSLVAPGGNEA
jgi:uncharacterized protein YciI